MPSEDIFCFRKYFHDLYVLLHTVLYITSSLTFVILLVHVGPNKYYFSVILRYTERHFTGHNFVAFFQGWGVSLLSHITVYRVMSTDCNLVDFKSPSVFLLIVYSFQVQTELQFGAST